MLHYLDDLDSKMEAIRAHFEREIGAEGPWTSYNSSLGRPLLDARKFEQGEKASAAKTGSEEPAAETSTPTPTEPTDASTLAPDLFSEQKA